MNLAENLKRIRKEHHLSQEQLAETLGVSRQSVSKWESNQAYPEMDKVLQLCKLFNINIDELLNQNLNEVNKVKQSKINMNKYIDDFLDYITKIIDMFSSLSWGQRFKCIIEQCLIVGSLIVVFLLLGLLLGMIVQGIIGFLPYKIYYIIVNILSAIYLVICFLLGVLLFLHIFKTRYLDYYVIVKEDEKIDTIKEENTTSTNQEEKAYLKKGREKIVIRDPKHTGERIIRGLVKCSIFCMKLFAIYMIIIAALSLIGIVFGIVVSFLFVKTGLVFIGAFFVLLACLLINVIILEILYSFIMNRKNKKRKMGICFLASLFTIGVGSGIFIIGVSSFNYEENGKIIEDSYTYTMQEDAYVQDIWCDDIHYIEAENEDVRVVVKHSDTMRVDFHENMYYTLRPIQNDFAFVRQVINDINEKKIINYFKEDIYVYTTKENIKKLRQNKDIQRYYASEEW